MTWHVTQAIYLGFNPTLVRLRLFAAARYMESLLILFQSHAGSIEASPNPLTDAHAGKVSIPRWFD